jgi:hypothetical protein
LLLLSSGLLRTLLWQNYSFPEPQTELYLAASICDTLEVTWDQGQFLTLAPLRSNGINQRSMWIFSKKIIQKEYPEREGKQSKDPTGRTCLCLRDLDCSNNIVIAISIVNSITLQCLSRDEPEEFKKRVTLMPNHWRWIKIHLKGFFT